MIAVFFTLLAADDLCVTDAAAGKPKGPDGGALDGFRWLGAVLSARGGGGQREQHLDKQERFGDAVGCSLIT